MADDGPQHQRWSAHVGGRVVVRVRSDDGRLRDVLGTLEEATAERLRVLTRRGPVDVDPAAVVAGKPVPPPPARPAPPHRAVSVADLEAVMAEHWQPLEREWLGGWLLRASDGFTRRANSVLAVGEPGMPLDVAVLEVLDWYTDRGLPPLAAVPLPSPDEPGAEALLAADLAFAQAGWQVVDGAGARVLTAATGELRAPADLPPGLRLHLVPEPDAGWLERFRYRGEAAPPQGLRLLTSAPEQVFAAVRDGDRTLAVARGSLARAWAGITAVEVDPGHRRRGLARALLAAIGEWAWRAGSRSAYVQVGETNAAALALYRSLGFGEHHVYSYVTPRPAARG